ncbi:MAG: hypothetical protein BZY81_05195 [SAR202 cluster bacterium Io17-Chloro-G4]|nr:MAG: hypothetical protein BZY81_05195 [SAR202 cluster bacterium Io17-Chloro-G4]
MNRNVESPGNLAARSAQASREVRRDSDLRRARTCYDHLAGVAGVDLLEEMLSRGWFRVEEGTKPSYHLTSDGERALLGLGVDLPTAAAQRRPFAYGCLDWTERRYHLRGSLSAAILTALSNSGTVVRTAGTRTVALKRPMVDWLQS